MLSVPGLLYSNAEKAVQGIRQDKATPAQWLAMIQKAGGIKAGEDRWLGLTDWLRSTNGTSLTRDHILRYIDDHRILLHEEGFGELEELDDYKRLNTEFQNLISKSEELWHDADHELEDFRDEMQTKYDDDWEYFMHDDERTRYEELESERDRYDMGMCDQRERAFNDMVDKYGYHFDNSFGYEGDNLVVGDEDAARRFIFDGIIDSQLLDFTTNGLDSYREIALWSPNAGQWNEKDSIHFGEVGQGRCIGWVRFGVTRVDKALTEDEYQQALDAMPGADRWVRMDSSAFVNKMTYTIRLDSATHMSSTHSSPMTRNGVSSSITRLMVRQWVSIPWMKQWLITTVPWLRRRSSNGFLSSTRCSPTAISRHATKGTR